MKNLYTLLAFIIFSGLTAVGQGKVDYDSRSRFYLGLNFGGTYHSNTEVDVNTMYRAGAGFTFGYSFGMKPKNLFSLDLQLRYLHAAYRGLSESRYTLDSTTTDGLVLNPQNIDPGLALTTYENEYGYYVPNFRSIVNDWSLELKLNTNRWRENTGWNFFVLGGIGTSRYVTTTDLYDNDPLNSLQIKPEADLSEKGVLISDYETEVVDNRDWMPSLGMGIEKQITPNAAFQIMGRMTWTRNNDFDGLVNNFSGHASGINDRYHYASAGIKFYLRGHDKHVKKDDDPIVRPNPPVTGQKPAARFTVPGTSPITVSVNRYTVHAIVQNVAGKQNITFTHNGKIINNYTYNANTDKLSYSGNLFQGQNTFTVTAINDYGRAEDQTVIIFEEQVKLDPPKVTFINPAVSNTTVNNAAFNLSATVLNVDNQQNITFFLNGVNYNNFSFNPSNHQLNASLTLVPGKNVITITGTNSVGTDSETTSIIYRELNNGNPPVVTIVNPSVDPLQTNNANVNVTATVLNVTGRNNINVSINGRTTNNFNFSNNTVTLTAGLVIGNNIVSVRGVNQYGQDRDETNIIYNVVNNAQPPIVNIFNPANGSVFSTPGINVNGQVQYVNSKNNITVRINGQATNNFSFNSGTKAVSFSANLVPGNNSIQIIGTNSDGQDQETVNVVYNKPVVKVPPVVNIIDPNVNNKTYTTANINAKATLLNVSNSNDIVVTFNGIRTYNFNFNSNTKLLTIPLTLNSGNNTLVVTGSNNDGTDSDQKSMRYKKAVTINPPTVNFTNPNISPATVNNPTYTVNAVTTNITGKNQIVLKQNGTVINSANYTFSASTISFPTTLVLGNNTFEVVVSNTAGSDSKTTVIEYEKKVVPCPKPTIGYVAPTPNSVVNTANHVIEAQINNYVSGTVVSLKLNGVSVGQMNYNSSTQIAKKSVSLNQGVNTLEITASNNCGTNKSTFILNYKTTAPPCNSPLVNITSSNQQTTLGNYLLTATVNHATSNQVTLKVNGVTKSFALNGNNLSATLNLKSGNNTINIEAVTNCGTDKKSLTVNYNPCSPPTVSITSSTKPVTVANYNLKANLTNVSNANQVTLTVNGIGQNFNLANGVLSANLTLKKGTNVIKVSVTNSCGTDSKTISVVANLCQTPQLKMVTPTSANVSAKNSSYTISARVVGDIVQSGISVKLNGVTIPFTFNASTKLITIAVKNLRNGKNSVNIAVNNACGSDALTYNITYNPCVPPSVSITSSTQPITVANYNLKANIANVSGPNQVTLTVNGIRQNFNLSNGLLSANLTLKNGTNTIKVTANSSCGNDSKTISVVSNLCQAPQLKMVTPSSTNVTAKNNTYAISTRVVGDIAQSGITVKLNGVTVPFTFNAGTKLINISVKNLKSGRNTVNVAINNACGSDALTYNITYSPCTSPRVVISGATAQTKTVKSLDYQFVGTITGMTSNKGVLLKLNGVTVSSSFNAATGKITARLRLKKGINTIVLSATNACGNDSKSQKIDAKICTVPTLKSLTPLLAPIDKDFQAINVAVTGATSANQITVKVNGRVVSKRFSNNKISFTATGLRVGSNSVSIVVKNDCGTDQLTLNVQRKACQKPTINQKTNATQVTSLTFPYSAVVTGVNAKSGIVLKVNNKAVVFNFNATSGLLTSSLLLKEGSNTIQLTATNSCGSVTKTHSVKASTCKKPEIKLGYPTNPNITTANSTFSILAVGINVVQSDIKVTNNGKSIPFSFDASKGKITVQVSNMSAGANNIKIKATKPCGTSEVNYVITYTGSTPEKSGVGTPTGNKSESPIRRN